MATTPRTIRRGSTGADVAIWQTFLAQQGITAGRPDGIFGPQTQAGTIAFQRAHGLTADGIVGPKTWEAFVAAGGATPAPTSPATPLEAGSTRELGAVTFLPFPGLRETQREFRLELARVAARLGMDRNAIAAVMSIESVPPYNPASTNATTQATGLIQFMPATARNLGTTVDALRSMSRLEQLQFVEAYFRPFAGRVHSARDHYLAVFMPSKVGHAPDEVIARRGEKVYDQNAGLDANRDGVLTVGDVGSRVEARIASAQARVPSEGLIVDTDDSDDGAGGASSSPDDDGPGFGAVLVVLGLAYVVARASGRWG